MPTTDDTASATEATRAAALTELLADAPVNTGHEQIRAFMHALADLGVAVLLINPDTKLPTDFRGPRQRTRRVRDRDGATYLREIAPKDGGVYQASTDVDVLDRHLAAYIKRFGRGCAVNLAIAPGRSGLVAVDADTPGQVAALVEFLTDAEVGDTAPTVLTPGAVGKDNDPNNPATWAHRDGGHWWFVLPQGAEMPQRVQSMTAEGGFSLIWGHGKYVLIPPSTRPEGRYEHAGAVTVAPKALVALIADYTTKQTRKRDEHAARGVSGNGAGRAITEWGALTPWSDILDGLPGWTNTGTANHDCGCDVWTAPGEHASPRSAIAHESGCGKWTDSPDPPLHIFTDNPGEPFDEFIAEHGRTITRLNAVSLINYDGNVGKAIEEMGLTDDLSVDDDLGIDGETSDGTEGGGGADDESEAEYIDPADVPPDIDKKSKADSGGEDEDDDDDEADQDDNEARRLGPFTLAEVERVCGTEAADSARRVIERHNTDLWNRHQAGDPRVKNAAPRNYLVTSKKLANAGFGDRIAGMTPASMDEVSAAWGAVRSARQAHPGGNTRVPVSKRWHTLDELARIPPPEWQIEKLLIAGTMARLTAPPESLKTFTALDMGLSVATGEPFAGSGRYKTDRVGHVLYVVGEGLGNFHSRVEAWRINRGLSREAINDVFTVLAGAVQFADERDMADVTAKVEETGAVLVIFDTQARCTVGLEENSATAQGLAIRGLDTLRENTGVSELLLHHPTKGNGADPRGSSAWNGALDTELLLERDGMDLTLTVTKMKDAATGFVCTLKAVNVPMPGDERGSLALQPGDPYNVVDPDDTPIHLLPFDQMTGPGKGSVKPIYELVQREAVPSVGLTINQIRVSASEKVKSGRNRDGTPRKVPRICGSTTADAACTLLVRHGWLVAIRKVPGLGHTYFAPLRYPDLDPADVADLADDDATDDESSDDE